MVVEVRRRSALARWRDRLDGAATRAAERALLLRPAKVAAALEEGVSSGALADSPTTWQLAQGVLRMLHRMVTRPESIGLSSDNAPRPGVVPRLMQVRPVRAPLLLAIGAVQPWDLTGLLAGRDRLVRHLVGTHHDRRQFAYDLQILRMYPGGLELLHDEVLAIVEGRHPRAKLYRATCVYEGYHERLQAAVEAALVGEVELAADECRDPDLSFEAFLSWCAERPRSMAGSIREWMVWGGPPPSEKASAA